MAKTVSQTTVVPIGKFLTFWLYFGSIIRKMMTQILSQNLKSTPSPILEGLWNRDVENATYFSYLENGIVNHGTRSDKWEACSSQVNLFLSSTECHHTKLVDWANLKYVISCLIARSEEKKTCTMYSELCLLRLWSKEFLRFVLHGEIAASDGSVFIIDALDDPVHEEKGLMTFAQHFGNVFTEAYLTASVINHFSYPELSFRPIMEANAMSVLCSVFYYPGIRKQISSTDFMLVRERFLEILNQEGLYPVDWCKKP